MSDTYRIELDRSLCSGMGDCVRSAPDRFVIADDGLADVLAATSSDESVIEAAQACPMAAVAIFRNADGEQVA